MSEQNANSDTPLDPTPFRPLIKGGKLRKLAVLSTSMFILANVVIWIGFLILCALNTFGWLWHHLIA